MTVTCCFLQSDLELWLGFTGTSRLVLLSPSPLLSRLWDYSASDGTGWDERLLLNATVTFTDHTRIQLVSWH